MKRTLVAAAIAAACQPVTTLAADDLEQMVVTGNRVEIPKAQSGVSVSVLTDVDIERLGYTSLLDVIRTLPGVSISNNGGAGKVSAVYLRGESSYRTLVLLDGVNISDPTNTQVATQFQHLLASDVERIEVLRGPQGMMYGAGAGGVINIISKESSEPLQARLGVEAGRYGAQQVNADLGGKRERWNYRVNVSRFENDGFNSRVSDTTGERDGYENFTGSARLGYRFTDALSVEGQVRRTDTESEFDGCYAGFVTTEECLDKFKQTSYRLAGNYQQDKTAHRVSLARQEISRDSLSLGESSYAVDGVIAEANYVGNSAIAGGELVWGAELEQQNYDSATSEQDLDSLGLFTEWNGNLADRVYYTLGYRRDRLESEDHNSWRVSVAYPVLLGEQQQLKYRASYGTGYRAPSPYEVAYNTAEDVAAVGPETSRGYELGLDYQLAELLRLEITYFDQQVTDAIVYDYSLGTWGAYAQDDGTSESEGVELSLAGDFNPELSWYLNSTWLDAVDTEGDQRLQVPQQVANLGLTYRLLGDRLSISGNWQRVADRMSPNPSWGGPALALEDYDKLDINAAYRLSDSVRLSLRGENVLDEDYREVAGYYTAGATVYAGVQLTL
ncbi:TonB-dependent receptor plug domain-containing protein [Microbulbifer hainanensis]|uniref:TonB-dependent receptor plug domain-containing protein n=1 Tax=Microbulbifer hainanensis TaxID=2735675 RepID=UPI00186798BE|nr:TonB-dependent receptor [Microbulbifer hainanensis]